jgi:chloride channel protein, CIC family
LNLIRFIQSGWLFQEIYLTHHKDKTVLRMMNVRNLIETDFEILSPDATLRDLVKAISLSHRNLYPVVDEDGILKGMVKLVGCAYSDF